MDLPFDTELLRARVRDVADFPEPGVGFKDITPLLADPVAFAAVLDALVAHAGRGTVDVDDVLATGGTAAACIELVETMGGTVAGIGFLIALDALGGAARLRGHQHLALLSY